ncbi:MAG: DeoR/GlpR transcriptional regulator [Marinilabiliaceae bacterium]|nr:DeoR/GlpR transcriptional regulator [Marinilabiliaceae bacterium]
MSNFDPNTTVGRRGLILKLLDDKGQVNVHELSHQFNVSEVTIRNDLTQLEHKNLLIRARGGAIKTDKVTLDMKLSDKKVKNAKEKEAIGKRASKLIEEGDTIVLDSGTTTKEVSNHLAKFKSLTVITNALNIAGSLAELEQINIIMPGGVMRKKSLSLVGSIAQDSFKNFFCDKLFIGADGIDVNLGFSTPHLEEAALNRTMLKMAKKVVLVVDSSKFKKRSLAVIGQINDIDIVVTDKGITEDDREKLLNAGVEVLVTD